MWRTIRRPFCITPVLGLVVTGFGAIAVSADGLELEGNWQLESIDSAAVSESSDKQMPFFEIKVSGVKGYDGCNRFFGSLDQPGAISSTRRACPTSTLRLPLDLNDLDAHLQTGCQNGDQLTIPARGRYPSSTYVRQLGAHAAAGKETSVTASEDAKPDVQPSVAPSKGEGPGPDPHKRPGFEKVQSQNKAKLREARERPGARTGKGCGGT